MLVSVIPCGPTPHGRQAGVAARSMEESKQEPNHHPISNYLCIIQLILEPTSAGLQTARLFQQHFGLIHRHVLEQRHFLSERVRQSFLRTLHPLTLKLSTEVRQTIFCVHPQLNVKDVIFAVDQFSTKDEFQGQADNVKNVENVKKK
jgi:hypothetical protein